MLNLIIKFFLSHALGTIGIAAATHGICTSGQWETVVGVLCSAIHYVIQWHKDHAHAVVTGQVEPLQSPKAATNQLTLLMLLMLPCLLIGCARSRFIQLKTSADGTRVETRQTITTFFDSQASASKIHASTSATSQSLSIGSVNEEASGTNALNVVGVVVEAAVKAAARSAVP